MRLVVVLASILLALASLVGGRVYGCFAVIVGREASADGSVLVGHNEQNDGRRVLNFRLVPRRQFAPDDVVKLRRGGTLPQLKQTWAFLWSEIPGMEFSDTHLNEWGVAITSDQCTSKEDDYDALAARGEIRDGGIGYMFRRLLAERSRTAREALDLAVRLIERFGYVDSGRTYVIADPREAWLLGVVRGRHWVAQRVPDDMVVLLPNVYIIGEVDLKDSSNFRASPDLVEYAERRGWFDPHGGRPFSFRKAYNEDRADPPDIRRWWAGQLVSGQKVPWPPEQPPPLGMRPRQKMTVADVIAILRDTAGPGRPISSPRTQECAVFQLRSGMPEAIGCIYWRTTAEPAVSVLTPWYVGINATPKSYYWGAEIETQLALDHHFSPPSGTFETHPQTAWWIFRAFQEAVHDDYAERIKVVQPVWAAFEARLFRQQPAIEKRARELWQTDPAAARAYLTRYCQQEAESACRQAKQFIRQFRDAGPRPD